MNTDFPKILTLLRIENGLSQKKVANALGISQSLLSHYEKGRLECNFDLLTKIADYYDVSCDYLLGRTTMPKPNRRKIKNTEKKVSGSKALDSQKEKINNALKIYYSIIDGYKSPEIIKDSENLLSISIYSMLRSAFLANPNNDKNYFRVNKDYITPAFAILLSSFEKDLANINITTSKTSPMRLYNEFPLEYKSLDEIINYSENYLRNFNI